MTADDIYAVLMEHQQAGTITNACTCGAGDLDNLCDSGTAIRRHRRHVALVLRNLFAA